MVYISNKQDNNHQSRRGSAHQNEKKQREKNPKEKPLNMKAMRNIKRIMRFYLN